MVFQRRNFNPSPLKNKSYTYNYNTRIQGSHSFLLFTHYLPYRRITMLATGLVIMLWSVRFHLYILFSSFQSLADNSSRKQNDLKLLTNVLSTKSSALNLRIRVSEILMQCTLFLINVSRSYAVSLTLLRYSTRYYSYIRGRVHNHASFTLSPVSI